MTDISLNDLNNSDPRIATSVVRDVKDAGSQPWEYQVDDIGAAGGLDSGASSLHEGDTQERQVSAEQASFVLVSVVPPLLIYLAKEFRGWVLL